MILPGFPMQLSMGGAAKSPPFSMSGSWETGNEGWAYSGATRELNNTRRTGSYSIWSRSGTMEQMVTAGVASGLNIFASCYSNNVFGSGTSTLAYKIGDGSFVTLQAITGTTGWQLLSGSFANTGNDDITIRLSSTNANIYWDDWEISGS